LKPLRLKIKGKEGNKLDKCRKNRERLEEPPAEGWLTGSVKPPRNKAGKESEKRRKWPRTKGQFLPKKESFGGTKRLAEKGPGKTILRFPEKKEGGEKGGGRSA